MHQSLSMLPGVFGFVVLALGVISSPALAQTPIAGGLEVHLLPGYKHAPLQGIDSVVGKIASKDLTIMYEIGPVPKEGAPLFGGSYVNQALRLPEGERAWLRHQVVGKQAFDIAYAKDGRLIVSTAVGSQGVNLHATAKTPEEVADVLLTVVTLAPAKPK